MATAPAGVAGSGPNPVGVRFLKDSRGHSRGRRSHRAPERFYLILSRLERLADWLAADFTHTPFDSLGYEFTGRKLRLELPGRLGEIQAAFCFHDGRGRELMIGQHVRIAPSPAAFYLLFHGFHHPRKIMSWRLLVELAVSCLDRIHPSARHDWMVIPLRPVRFHKWLSRSRVGDDCR